ncbi:Rod shape-determining protein MreD [Paucilactobacillus oligofermentans DSM 15707 = LMG 22743]|nr:rod shape-determining protein MreD [Paucilactobacillus oligofermentans]CUS26579.1 Rod shape-determining protein MreD [Paucilactobacillus oligofermentans DSM 15707 = LMG 22743]
MYRLSRMRFIFPIGLLLCFFLDGSVSSVFSDFLFSYPYSTVSHLVVLWMVLGVIQEGRNERVIPFTFFAVVIGIIFDSYYAGILGLFVFLFPIIIWVTRMLTKNFAANFLNSIMIFFIDIALLELLNYVAYSIVGVISVSFSDFVLHTLAPTLALNLVYFVILYLPISAIYDKYARLRS